jgi:hypothetical protein
MARPSAKRALIQEEFVPETKHARMNKLEDESECVLTDESEDEAMPNDVNEDPLNPFGYGDMCALSLF